MIGMNQKEIHKILMELIYTPDAKPRFVGGDLDDKLKRINDTAIKLQEIHDKSIRFERAWACLSDSEFPVEDQLRRIERESDGDKMIDGIEGVQVIENFEYRFTVDDFLSHIE